MISLEKLPKDILFILALKFDLPDLLSFCESSDRIKKLVYDKNDIWLVKLNEFPNYREFGFDIAQKSYKDIYINLYELRKLKKELKLKETLLELYNLEKLSLNNRGLKTLPKEIGNLVNLKYLNVGNNQIRTLPKEIVQLINLETLYLHNNQIQSLPKKIGHLVNLKVLNLYANLLGTLPKEIRRLINLKELSLSANNLRSFPEEIASLVNLEILNLGNNQFILPKKIGRLVNFGFGNFTC
jgi:Leucine-rich repeat (LRR) protein